MQIKPLFVSVSVWRSLCVAIVLVALYVCVAWLARGEAGWWYIDFVAGGNVYWGDDAYRYFLARTAWLNPEIYWFNFVLPAAISLDGVLTSLAGGDLFMSRALKAVPLTASLFLVYHAALQLGVKRRWALLSALLLALTPIYVFVSLSFYGESWLVFFISLALYFLSAGRLNASAWVIGLMPLIRIESMGLLGGFVLLAMLRKDWRALLTVFVPGFIYFLLVIIWGPGISVFLGWRFELMQVYVAIGAWYGGSLSQIFDVLFWPWLLAAAMGLCLKSARPVFPAAIGAAIIVTQMAVSVLLERGSFEARFLLAAFPLMAVGLALLLQRVEELCGTKARRDWYQALVAGFAFTVLSSHLLSFHVFKELKDFVAAYRELPATVREAPFSMRTYFKQASVERIDGYREYADVAMRMMEENPEVETLVVSDPNALYFLDPKRIPGHVNVVFPLFGWPTLDPVLDGSVTVGYFPHPPFSGYFALDYPKNGDSLLLYMDDMRLNGYPFHWEVQGNHIYLFSATQRATSGITALPRKQD